MGFSSISPTPPPPIHLIKVAIWYWNKGFYFLLHSRAGFSTCYIGLLFTRTVHRWICYLVIDIFHNCLALLLLVNPSIYSTQPASSKVDSWAMPSHESQVYTYVYTRRITQSHTHTSLTATTTFIATFKHTHTYTHSGTLTHAHSGTYSHRSPLQPIAPTHTHHTPPSSNGVGELVQLIRAQGVWSWVQGYEFQSWL